MTAETVLDPLERLDALTRMLDKQIAETEAWLAEELARAQADVERWSS